MSEANQGVHQGQLSWVIKFEPWDAFTVGKHGGLGQVVELSSVNKAFQDILLDTRDNCRKRPRAFGGVGVGCRRPF